MQVFFKILFINFLPFFSDISFYIICLQSGIAIKRKENEIMEKIIILALVFLWLSVTFLAGYLLEQVSDAIKKHRKKVTTDSNSNRNILILKSTRRSNCEKMAS